MRRKKISVFKRLISVYIFFSIFLVIIFFVINIQNFSLFPKPIINPLPASIKAAKIINRRSIEILLDQKKIQYKKVVNVIDSSYVVNLEDGAEVIISSKKDIESQISSLQLILGRFTIEGKHLARLDFRYTNPIIVLKN